MSEVKRYGMSGFGGGLIEIDDGPFMASEDFDAQRLRADTAEAELKVIKQSIASLKNERAADDRKLKCLGAILGLLEDHPIIKAHQLHIDAALNPNPEAESHE